jgi:hypothetical protein
LRVGWQRVLTLNVANLRPLRNTGRPV